MNSYKIYLATKRISAVITFLVFTALSSYAQNSAINACVECHSRTVKKDLLHGPTATDCSSCHISTGQKHPNDEETAGFTLFAEGEELCYSCHIAQKEEHSLKYIHKPTKNGQCMECHEVHSSDNANLVFTTAPDLCFFCHGEFEEKSTSSHTVHKASFEGDACLQCHDPHASMEKRLLVDGNRELCLSCHNKIIQKEDGTKIANIEKHLNESSYQHKALTKRCTSCHNPHFSDRDLLLQDEFTIGPYAKGVEESFTLCFNCHDSDLFNAETTDYATNFREGERNLHYVHLNQEKARNCTSCHDIHAANNTKLIATTVKFGRWNMPLNYIEQENGGTCATGCHKERGYTR